MFGNLVSSIIKVTTLPVDAASAAVDVVTGGNGSKKSRNDPNSVNPFALVEQVRDAVADTAEQIDKED